MPDVAYVSEPPNSRADTRTASSQPIASASRSATSACGGPMETTVTVPPSFSRMVRAASMPVLSSWLMMEGTPSRISVPVLGSIFTSTVSGTCLIHTTIFIAVLFSFRMKTFFRGTLSRTLQGASSTLCAPCPFFRKTKFCGIILIVYCLAYPPAFPRAKLRFAPIGVWEPRSQRGLGQRPRVLKVFISTSASSR